MKTFVDQYGLLLVTFLYFLATVVYTVATIWMANVARREHSLKTRPAFGVLPASFHVIGWESLKIKQEVVNIGLGFVTLDRAEFEWSLTMDNEAKRHTSAITPLPFHLAPGQKLEIVFELSKAILDQLDRGRFNDASELIDGMLWYEYHGLDDVIRRASSKPPLPKLHHLQSDLIARKKSADSRRTLRLDQCPRSGCQGCSHFTCASAVRRYCSKAFAEAGKLFQAEQDLPGSRFLVDLAAEEGSTAPLPIYRKDPGLSTGGAGRAPFWSDRSTGRSPLLGRSDA